MPYKDIEYKKAADKERTQGRRTEWFASHPCIMCGSTEDLQLDHIDPSKKVSHRIWNWGKERRDAELKKCQSLCHDCHWDKTRVQNGYGLKHGTVQGNRYYGCKCDLCRRAVADAANEYRWRTGTRHRRVVQQQNGILIQS